MKLANPPFVVTVFMPMLCAIGVCLLCYGAPPVISLISLPLLVVIAFFATLAEVQDRGQTIRIKRWWYSKDVAKADIAKIRPSLFDGVDILQLRHPVRPWGRVFFVPSWSDASGGPVEEEKTKANDQRSLLDLSMRAVAEFLLVAASGFLAGRAYSSGVFGFHVLVSSVRFEALAFAGMLLVVFAVARAKRLNVANVVLFVATFVIGLVR